MMGKTIVGLAVGVFVSAVALEVLRRTNPNCFRKVKDSVKGSYKAAKAAFKEGYANWKFSGNDNP